jgi:hypothetical protein
MKTCWCVIAVKNHKHGKYRRNQPSLPVGYVMVPGKHLAALDVCPSCGGSGVVQPGGKVPPIPEKSRDREVAPCNVCNRPCRRMLVCPNCNRKGCDVCCPEWVTRFCPDCKPYFDRMDRDASDPGGRPLR